MNALVEEWTGNPPQDIKTGLPAIVDHVDFMAVRQSEPPQLVNGLLHQGSKLVVGGGSKSFKTWTLLDLALSVAYGKPWLGHPTTKGKVLYVNFEIQDYAWQTRIDAVCAAKGIKPQAGAIQFWNLRGCASSYLTLLPEIISQTRTANYALMVLDPVYKLYGNMDENKAGDVAALMNSLESLAVQTGASTAFGAHFSKGNQSGKEAIDRISGSGVFARDPDSILMFTRHEEDECFTVETILRNFAPIEPFAVRWQFPLFTRDDELDPARLKQSSAGRKREYDPRKILKAIADTTPENGISINAWSQSAGLPRQTLTNYMPELRQQGLIATAGEGRNSKQYITAKGLELIGAAPA